MHKAILNFSLAGLVLICNSAGQAQVATALQKKIYVFDAGSAASEIASGAIGITPENHYNPQRGYGWTISPAYSFHRRELTRSRNALTRDGVTAKHLAFRADVPSGKWWLTLWMEAGTEDSSTVALVLGNKRQRLSWHAFQPPAEPRATMQRIYRVLHRSVQVGQNGLQWQLLGGADSVRVLGFALHPDPVPTSAPQQAWLQRLVAAGNYNSTASLDTLQADLEKISNEAFAAYWLEHIQLLHRAEQLFAMAGWERANEETGLGLFERLHQAVMLLDGLLDHDEAASSPLYERALRTRGKLLYWLGEERGGPHEISGGQRDLTALHQRHPQDPLLAMYCGKKIDLPDACDDLATTANAPAWSIAQREALCRLRGIVRWWVNERQATNGEFGGKLGDDVELLRWWTPLIMAGDTVALKGWQRLADGVWESDQTHDGYAREPSDVEHSSEFISDTAPAMILYRDDAKYLDRLRPSARHFEKLWTGMTPAGHRFFRSAWFSSTQVETAPPKNRDVEYNTRAVKAVRYLAWKTGDAAAIRALHEWSLAWVGAAMRTDKGKPAGIIPASVRFPDEAINGDETTWHKANMYWNYFDWEHHAGSMMLDQLLFTFTLTRDERLLKPLFAALDLIRTHEAASGNNRSAQAGSAEWAAAKLRKESAFWSVVEQWRFLSGDTRYDDLIARHGTPYARYRLTGEEAHLQEGLQVLLEATRYNTPLLTSEVLHTDRVYAPGADHLKAMLTGDGVPESMSPYYAVSWENTDADFTALVTDSGKERLGVKIFSHAATERALRMRLWQLAPGTYRMKLQTDKNAVTEETIRFNARGERVPLRLPPQKPVTITFERVDAVLYSQSRTPLAIAKSVTDKLIRDTSFELKLVPQETVLGVQVVDFRQTLGEEQPAIAYALSYVVSPKDTAISFGFSNSGGAKIWLNDRLVFRHAENRAAHLAEVAYDRFAFQDTLRLALQKGANKLFVKIATQREQWIFFLRPITPAGDLESAVQFSLEPIAPELASAWLCLGPFPASDLDLEFAPEKKFQPFYRHENKILTWTTPPQNLLAELVIPPNATYRREPYADWHYAIGAAMLSLLHLADETGEQRYVEFVKKYCDFILSHHDEFAWQYHKLHAFRGSYHRLFRRTMLDDTGAPALPFVEWLSREHSDKLREFVMPIAEYVLRQQVRLPEGTFCRSEPEPNTVWADDLFMSVPFLLRMGKITGERIYFDEAARQILQFAERLRDPKTGLFHHGWFGAKRKTAVALWGRANGWIMWAMSEALLHLPSNHPGRTKVRKIFRAHVASLAKYQNASGLWHQVLDHPESYEETSCSAMFVLAMARGVRNGWIEKEYQKNVLQGWRAIEKKIEADGTVHGICRGTGIGDDLDFYFQRATFDHDPRGLGAVITAGIEVAKLASWLEQKH